jgi:penicillin amidase
MRASLAAVGIVVCAMIAGCGTKPVSNNPPSIAVSPTTVTTNGPVVLKATVNFSHGIPAWSLTGPGALSGSSGFQVTYRPPSPVGTATTATITASVEGVSVSVPVTIAPPSTSVTLGAGKIPGLTGAVTVTYDAYDIPHIACAAAIDCFAVQGYVQAHDRLFPMDFLRRVAKGQLAELIGPLGLSQDLQLRTLFTTRDGQRLEVALDAALHKTGNEATATKVDAFVKGVNAYLAELKASGSKLALPGEYAQLPYPVTAADIPDWTSKDVLALARLQQFQLSESIFAEQDYGKFAAVYCSKEVCGFDGPLADSQKMRAWIRSAPPPGVNTHTLPVAPPRGGGSESFQTAAPTAAHLADWASSLGALQASYAPLRESLKPLDQSFGSNNWVISGALSASGKAMVANDPHLSLNYPPLFHLFTMTSSAAADSLDIAGGSFPGIPGALVGRGAHVGWGVTVVGYDVTDIYLDQVVPVGAQPFGAGGPTCANSSPIATVAGFGCAVRTSPAPALVPVLFLPQTFNVRLGAGSAGLKNAADPSVHLISATQALVVVVPHHGPLVAAPDAKGKTASVRWTGQEGDTNDLKAFFGLNTAANVDAAMTALADYTTGAQNFVLADDAGNIAYDPHAYVPVRNFTDPLKVGAKLIAPWLPIPGDGTAEWGTGNDADHCAGTGANAPARACWIADADLPQGKNPIKGFFATANADPVGISDDRGAAAPIPAPFPNVAAGGSFKNYLSFEWDDSTSFRHAEITKVLGTIAKSGAKVSLADMEALQRDHVSLIGATFTTILKDPGFDAAAAAYPDFKAAREMLTGTGTTPGWSFDCPTGLLGSSPSSATDPDPAHARDSAACYLFHGFLRVLLRNVFADDLGVVGLGVNGGAAVKAMLYMLSTGTDQSFCNDVRPDGSGNGKKTCGTQVVTALITAYDTLIASKGAPSKWQWGRVHTMQPVSQLSLVTEGYEPGPYARPGGAFTVDVGNPSLSSASLGSFAYGSSGNVRHISVMDPAAPVVRMQLPGPQRDVATSNLYGPDLLGLWVTNTYFDFPYKDSIAPNAVASQSFSAP